MNSRRGPTYECWIASLPKVKWCGYRWRVRGWMRMFLSDKVMVRGEAVDVDVDVECTVSVRSQGLGG